MADGQSTPKEELLRILIDGQSGLLRTARRVLRDHTEAEDIVQGVLESVVSAPNLIEDVENVAAWLATLVFRRSVDILRKLSRRRFLNEAEIEHLPDSDPFVPEILEEKETLDAIASAVESLPPELRYAFEGNVLDGKTFRQLAEESNIPMGTLMTRKQRALKLIRNELTRKGILP